MVESSAIENTEDFDVSSLVKAEPGEATLSIQVASEWEKGYKLINKVILMMMKDTHIQNYVDEYGDDRTLTHLHPQLLPFLQERRRMADQIWKFIGGEAINEGRKKVMHNMADIIFQMTQDEDFLEKNKDKFKQILDVIPHD